MQQQLQAILEPMIGLFDQVRIVNPRTKKILLEQAHVEPNSSSQHACYQLWNRQAMCENCISLQALERLQTTEKWEYRKDEIFYVLATPIEVAGTHYVMEMVRKVNDTTLVQTLAGERSHMKTAIRELQSELLRDNLTGCYNRKYLTQTLPRLLKTARPVVVAVFDLNDFKRLNDTYGHLAGDQVLIAVGERFQKLMQREPITITRLGGDEFVAVFQPEGAAAIEPTIVMLREQFTSATITLADSTKLSVYASCGYTVSQPGDSITMLLARADEAMYLDKKTMKKTPQE